MADSKELQTQLDLQNQINKALQARAKMFDAQAKQLSSQALLAKELCNAMECKDLDGLEERVGSLSGSLNQAADAASRAGSEMDKAASAPAKNLEKQQGMLGNILGKLSATKVAAVAGGAAFVNAFKKVGQTLSMVFGGLKTIVGGVFKVGKALIAVPLGILKGFVSAAAEGSGSVSELAKALQTVKKEMGDLSKGSGKAIVDGFDKMRKSGSALSDAGINLRHIYGRGQAGLAAALADLTELAKAAGASFSMLKDEFAANADKLVMMNKGLGVTPEALAEITRRAHNTGKDVGEELVGMGNLAIQLGDRFGVSAKTIGKNMSSMIADVSNFGTLSRKELAATATYMAKLGLEAKDLQGVIDKFDDFEGAADAVSQLNQAFGIQLDTMDMMNAQNPAERIDQMRNAFFAAGKSIEDMTRQERKLLEAQTGLSGSALENAFAIENQGVAYEDMESASEDAEANAMSEKEVMLELAKSIEKLLESGDGFKSFFGAFNQGMKRGFSQNEKFRESIQAIRKSLKLFYEFGRKVGDVLADLADHLGLFDAIKRIFDPAAFKGLLDKIYGYLDKFRNSTKTGGDYSMGDMIRDMFEEVKNYILGPGADGAGAFSKFFENAIRFIGDGIASMIPFVFEKMTQFFNFLAMMITDPSQLKKIGGGATSGIGGALADSFAKIGEQLVEHGPALLDSLKAVFGALFDRLKPFLFKMAVKAILFQIAKATAIALGKALITGMVTKALKAFGKTLGAGMGNEIQQQAPPAMGKAGGGFFESLNNMVEGAAKINSTQLAKATGNLLIVAGGFMLALIAFAGTVKVMHMLIGKIPWNELIKVFAVVGVGILAILGMALISLLLEPATMATAAGFLFLASLGFMAAIGVFALAVRGVYEVLKPVSWDSFIQIMQILGTAILATIALGVLSLGLGMLTPVVPVIIFGLGVAAGLFTSGIAVFAAAVMAMLPTLKQLGSNAPVLEKAINALIKMVDAISLMGKMGAAFAAIGLFIGFLKRGFAKAAGFMKDILPHIQDIVKGIMAIPMTNPDAVLKRITIIGYIATALQSLADIGMDAAKMGIVSQLLGGPSMSEIFESMGGFIQKIGGTLAMLIGMVISLASSLPDGDAALKKIDAVSKAIGAVASLASALTSPLEAITEIYKESGIIFKGDIGKIVKAVVDGVSKLMDAIGKNLALVLNTVLDSAKGITDPESALKKMEVIAKAMEAVGHFAGAVGKAADLINLTSNDGNLWKGRDQSDRLLDVVDIINTLMPVIGAELTQLMNTIKKITIEDPAGMLVKMDVIVKAMNAVGSFVDILSKMQQLSTEGDVLNPKKVSGMISQVSKITRNMLDPSVDDALPAIMETLAGSTLTTKGLDQLDVAGNILTGLTTFTTKMHALAEAANAGTALAGLGDTVAAVIAEAQKAVSALNTIGDIPITATLDNFAKAIGTSSGEFTINNEPIQMTVQFKVNMDAQKVADVLIDKAVMTTPLATAEG